MEAVERLAASGRRILILSNSSRRSEGVLGKLEPMGYNPAWFAGALTSGELTHRCYPRQKQVSQPGTAVLRAHSLCVCLLACPAALGVPCRCLQEKPDQFWQDLGTRCIHYTWGSRGSVSLEGLGLQVTGVPASDCLYIVQHPETVSEFGYAEGINLACQFLPLPGAPP